MIAGKRVNVRCDIAIRPGTADHDVFNEVFFTREYDVDGISPKVVIDAGAHIGLTSVMLASRYPGATIISIEPESSNFRLLVWNARDYNNIRPINAGLWAYPTRLRIENPEAATWAFQVVEDAELKGGIRAVSIPQIMEDLGLQHVDVVKIDIEGSEIEVLRTAQSWIGRVGVIMIELHDRFRPGCARALEQALAGYAYERNMRGNTVFIRNIQKIGS